MECSKMFNVSPVVGYMAHIKPIVQFMPNALSIVDSFLSSGLQFIHVFWKEGHLDHSFHKPHKKKSQE